MKKSELKELIKEMLINEGVFGKTFKRIGRELKGGDAPMYEIDNPNDALYQHAQKEFSREFDYIIVNPNHRGSQKKGMYGVYYDGYVNFFPIPEKLENYEFEEPTKP